MPVFKAVVRTLAFYALLTTIPATSWAQAESQTAEPQALPPPPQAEAAPKIDYLAHDYSKSVKPFPDLWAPYQARHVPEPTLSNTPRLESLMRGGKIYLSMDDAVALALENNLDLVLARYNLDVADTDVLRARAGTNILSGTVGSGTGGTSVAAGGAGTGTNGLVSSTLGIGAPITSFDPSLSATVQMDRAYALSSSALSGRAVTNNNTGTANFSYQQGFHSGTDLLVGFNNTHLTTNNPLSALSPTMSSGFQFRLTQELLQGFGFLPNTRFIRIAKNNREISDVAFRLQVITTVDQIENLYWNLVYAFEDVRVQQEALAFAEKTLADNQKAAQVGTLPPIQVVSAQSTVATNRQALTVAETNLQLQQLLMKNAVSRSLEDPQLAGAEVIPTSTIRLPDQEQILPTEDLIKEAFEHRAELAESRIDLTSRQINVASVRNTRLPSLNLYAYYGGNGLGGSLNPNATFCTPGAASGGICISRSRIPKRFLSGPVDYGSTLTQLVDSTAPDKGAGVTLTIPVLNRTAQANQLRAELEFR